MTDPESIALPGCRFIYSSAGQAGEYAPLTVNPYIGCGHCCKYCYVPRMTRQTREEFNAGAVLREDFFNLLTKDAVKYQAAGIDAQCLISFTSDPYHLGDTAPTREVIKILQAHGLAFCCLSKGGSRALRDLDLYRRDRDCYACTLTGLNDAFSLKWEPKAALPADRIATLKAFHDAGIFTWPSLEPVLDIEQTLELIRATYKFVDLYKIGKVNYEKELKDSVNWERFTHRVVMLMHELDKAHYVKADLQPYLPPGYHNPMRIRQHH
jgi:DNA repair photolyase